MENDKRAQKMKYQNHVKNVLSEISSTNHTVTDYEELDKDTQSQLKVEAYFGFGPRPNPTQLTNRIKQVENMRLAGFTKREIIYYCKHNWGVAKNNAVNYYALALENFEQDFRENFDKEVDYLLEIRWNLYKKAMKAGKIEAAHKILKDITQIEGVYDNKPAINPSNTEFDEVDEYVKENKDEINELAED